MFIDNLIENIKKKNNPSVIGLDSSLEYVPQHIKEASFEKHGVNLKGAAEAILMFNKKIIDSVFDVVPAIKLQLAYYEMYGIDGLQAFCETIEYAKIKGLLIIADGKRNDIGSTARAYSTAYLGNTIIEKEIKKRAFSVDALTINPYLGFDGIQPFIETCKENNKGIFVLAKTSNPSSGQLQDLITNEGKKIYEIVADYINQWGEDLIGSHGYSSIGAVIGATYPQEAKELRKRLKNAYILVPGYGAQGGTAEDIIHSFNDDGLGAIVNASRSIMCAYKSEKWSDVYGEDQFQKASRAETIRMRNDINEALSRNL